MRKGSSHTPSTKNKIAASLKNLMTRYGKARQAGKKSTHPSIRKIGEQIGKIKSGLRKSGRRAAGRRTGR